MLHTYFKISNFKLPQKTLYFGLMLLHAHSVVMILNTA